MEILPGVHKLVDIANHYLVEYNEKTYVVDTGFLGGYGSILKYARLHCEHPISSILITHAHPDHAGGLYKLAATTGAAVYVGEADLSRIKGIEPPYDYTMTLRILNKIIFWHKQGPVKSPIGLKDMSGKVEDGVSYLATPGHTMGSTSFFFPIHGGCVFTGDALVSGMFGRELKTSYRIFSVDMAEYRRSLGRIAQLDFKNLLTGHGTPIIGNAGDCVRSYIGHP